MLERRLAVCYLAQESLQPSCDERGSKRRGLPSSHLMTNNGHQEPTTTKRSSSFKISHIMIIQQGCRSAHFSLTRLLFLSPRLLLSSSFEYRVEAAMLFSSGRLKNLFSIAGKVYQVPQYISKLRGEVIRKKESARD